MIAYFDTLNAKGGINGRKIVLTNSLDDGGSPTQFTQDVHTLIDQDHVFAAGVLSAWFTPGYFVSTKTPTYGYNVSANWQTAPNLFAVGGSTQIYSAGFPQMAYFIKKVGAKSVAFISYGPSIASSYDACNSYANGMKAAGINVNFVDVGAQLGGSYSSDAQRMQQAGSQLVVTCMRGHGQRHPGPGHPAVRAEDQAAVAERLRPDPAQPVQQPDAGGLPQQHGNPTLRGGQHVPVREHLLRACRPTSRP